MSGTPSGWPCQGCDFGVGQIGNFVLYQARLVPAVRRCIKHLIIERHAQEPAKHQDGQQ
jgi:hypothetical protein